MKIKLFLISVILLLVPMVAQAAVLNYESEEDLKPAMDSLWAAGIIHGYPDGTYGLGNDINRAEFTKMVVIALKETALETNCFKDVHDEWFSTYVCKAAKLGILDGYPDGTFKPDQPINFAEASKIIANAAKLNSDCDSCNSGQWFERYVRALEIKNAIPEAVTSFDQRLKRGVVFEMMWRALNDDYRRPYTTFNLIEAGGVDDYLIGVDQVLAAGRIYPQVGLVKKEGKVVLVTHLGGVEVKDADEKSFEFIGELLNDVLIFRDQDRLYVLNGQEIETDESISPKGWGRSTFDERYPRITRLLPLDGGSESQSEEGLYYVLGGGLKVYETYHEINNETAVDKIFSNIVDTPKLRQEQENAGAPELGGDVAFLLDDDQRYLIDKNGIYLLDQNGYKRLARFTGVAREIEYYGDEVKILADAESVYVFHSNSFDLTNYKRMYEFTELEGADADSFARADAWAYNVFIGVDSKAMYFVSGDKSFRLAGAKEEDVKVLNAYDQGTLIVFNGKVIFFRNGVAETLDRADAESLSEVGQLVKDKNSIWLFDREKEEFIPTDIRDARFIDDDTYELDGIIYYVDTGNGKVKSLPGADVVSFEVIAGNDYLYRDRNNVYFDRHQLDVPVDSGLFYSREVKSIEGLDPEKFQMIETHVLDRKMFRDDDQLFLVYSWWQGEENYIEEIKNVNISNFRVYWNPKSQTEKTEKGWTDGDKLFFTDGTKVWMSDLGQMEDEVLQVLTGVDPETFDVGEYLDSLK